MAPRARRALLLALPVLALALVLSLRRGAGAGARSIAPEGVARGGAVEVEDRAAATPMVEEDDDPRVEDAESGARDLPPPELDAPSGPEQPSRDEVSLEHVVSDPVRPESHPEPGELGSPPEGCIASVDRLAVDDGGALVTGWSLGARGTVLAIGGNPFRTEAESGGVHVFACEQQSWVPAGFLPSPTRYLNTGAVVACTGERILVGSPRVVRGEAVVHRRVGPREWVVEGLLTPEPGPERMFAWSVALDTDLAAVTAIDLSSQLWSVQTFALHSGSWRAVGVLRIEDPTLCFGAALALRDGLLVVGAPARREPTSRAFFYRWKGDGWDEELRWGPTPEDNGSFGWRVAICESGVFVLQPAADAVPNTVATFHQADGAPGTIHWFRSTEQKWTLASELRPPTEQTRFGLSLAADEGFLAVSTAPAVDARVLVYALEEDGPSFCAAWQPDGPESIPGAMAIAGSTLFVEVFRPADDPDATRARVHPHVDLDRRWRSTGPFALRLGQ